jgi:predicted nucleic acid-binding protein
MEILLDASAIMAFVLNEPNRDTVINLTKNTVLVSPEMISYEIGNGFVSLLKRHKLKENEVIEAFNDFSKIPLRMVKVDFAKALKIACKYKIYAYDAYYLEVALRLKLPLITFDITMRKVGIDINLKILPEEN